MKKALSVLLVLSLVLVSGTILGQQYDVPFVPTPYEVVTEMLKMADVNKNDVLYDLGCGDGRIVIMAAEKIGCRGVGVDINPVRIEESTENAVKAKVTDRVRFIEQNLFDVDISEATVVTLYLLSNVNLKLRPKLLRDLRPGTRVVSHNYSMGEWEPEKSTELAAGWDNHSVFFWIVPANVSGKWEWMMPSGKEQKHCVLTFNQYFQNVMGIARVDGEEVSLRDVKLTGDKLQFTMDQNVDGKTVSMYFEGTANDNALNGTAVTVTGANKNNITWNAKRDPSTKTRLDSSEP